MRGVVYLVLITSMAICGLGHADTTIWQGSVNSDGSPTKSVKLTIGEKYRIKVSGTTNLGKWRMNKQPLENDACFEFYADPKYQETAPKKIDAFKSSNDISICEGIYSPIHVYESKPFVALQSGVHFWVHDTDYEDNSGSFDAEVILVEEKK